MIVFNSGLAQTPDTHLTESVFCSLRIVHAIADQKSDGLEQNLIYSGETTLDLIP